MTEREAKKELMRRALDIKPTVHVGKEGLKDSVYTEIDEQLKKNRLIKIRVLDNADSDTKDVAEAIVSFIDVMMLLGIAICAFRIPFGF